MTEAQKKWFEKKATEIRDALGQDSLDDEIPEDVYYLEGLDVVIQKLTDEKRDYHG